MSIAYPGITHCKICGVPLSDEEWNICKCCRETISGLPPTAHKIGCRFCTDKNFEIRISVNKKNQATEKWENYYDYDINYCPCCGTKIEDIDF